MAATASGIVVPGDDPSTTPVTPLESVFNNLGKSLNGRVIVPVADAAGAAQLLVDLASEGFTPSAANPVYIDRADNGTLYRHAGSSWVVYARPWEDSGDLAPNTYGGGYSEPNSSLRSRKITAGGIEEVFLSGTIRPSSGTIGVGITGIVALLATGSAHAPAATKIYPVVAWIGGGADPVYIPNASLEVRSSGNLVIHNRHSQAITGVIVDGVHYLRG